MLTARLAFVNYLRARHAEALRWSALAVLEAQMSGDSLAIASAYNVRDLVLTGAGRSATSRSASWRWRATRRPGTC